MFVPGLKPLYTSQRFLRARLPALPQIYYKVIH